MVSIEQLCRDLKRITDDVSGYVQYLEREREEILNSMNKVQGTFGDQQAGQQIVTLLMHSINDLSKADSSFYVIQSRINEYINYITK